MNRRSPARKRTGNSRGANDERAHDDGEDQRQHKTLHPEVVDSERAEIDRQAKRDEHDDLSEARNRVVEPLGAYLVGCLDVADQNARDENGQEA